MKCPECNGATAIIDTRVSKAGKKRRHECFVCGNRFTTLEITTREYKFMTGQLKKYEEVEALFYKFVNAKKEIVGVE